MAPASDAAGLVITTNVVEQRVDHLVACIQPNAPSELRRLTIASYVCNLIKACFAPHQVDAFLFGSVPLRAYLPDGDIDISLFSPLHGAAGERLRDTWAGQLLRVLQRQQARPDAPFHIRDCQIIQAEVKLIKCVVGEVVVDISFNAIGGLCTVAFLEWVDRRVGRGHLFKRSIVLVKAWCYYEARLLGAHHGLISSYALEAMVLYVLNLHGQGLTSPLQVLRRFLEVFAAFDWDRHCLSMLGPIPLASFPHPHVDHAALPAGQPLLDSESMRAAVREFSVHPAAAVAAFDTLLGTTNPAAGALHLPLKHLNIMDPLLPTNNLGRSVSKASFARIRTALAFGAGELTALLRLEPLAAAEGINRYFRTTWRSPMRMAADNQIFQSRLAGSGGANVYLAAVPPGQMMHGAVMGMPLPHGRKPMAGRDSGMPPGRGGRRGQLPHRSSTSSMPDISRAMEQAGWAGSMAVRQVEPQSVPGMSRPPPPQPPPPAAATSGSQPTASSSAAQTRHSGADTPPVLSPRAASAPATCEGVPPVGLQSSVVAASLQPTANGHPPVGAPGRGMAAPASAPMQVTLSQHQSVFAASSSAVSTTGIAASDIFISDLGHLLHNLTVARHCQPRDDAMQLAQPMQPPPPQQQQQWRRPQQQQQQPVATAPTNGGAAPHAVQRRPQVAQPEQPAAVASAAPPPLQPPAPQPAPAPPPVAAPPAVAPAASPVSQEAKASSPPKGEPAASAPKPPLRAVRTSDLPAPEPGSYAAVTANWSIPVASGTPRRPPASGASSATGTPKLQTLVAVGSPGRFPRLPPSATSPRAPGSSAGSPSARIAPPEPLPRTPWGRGSMLAAANAAAAAANVPPSSSTAPGSAPGGNAWGAPPPAPVAAPVEPTSWKAVASRPPVPPRQVLRVGSEHGSVAGQSGGSTPAMGSSPRAGSWVTGGSPRLAASRLGPAKEPKEPPAFNMAGEEFPSLRGESPSPGRK